MTGTSKYVIAIDLGTSGPKAALATTRGEILAHELEPTRVLYLPGGGVEQDPREWWAALERAIERVLARRLAPVEDIVGVGVTAQWSGTVAVDRGGEPLGNAIIWMDTRGAPHVRALTGGPLAIAGYRPDRLIPWLRLTGGAPGHSGKDSLAHILYLQHEAPTIYAAADKFLEPKDWLNFKLTGRMAASYDSITLHWVTDNRDLRRVDYHPGLLKIAGVDRAKLPDLLPASSVLGPLLPEVARRLGLRPDVQVVMGTPDVQGAALGSGAVRDYEGHLYVGTSSWITCHVPFKKTDLLNNMASLPSPIPGRYFIANDQETAGVCLTFLRDNIFWNDDPLRTAGVPADVYALFDQVAANVPPGSDSVIFTPWLVGERTPVEDPNVRAAFFNLTMRTTRPQLIRAVLEGVAFNARWLLAAVERFASRPFPSLRYIGGGARSELWCQIMADVLDRPIDQVKDPVQANVRGAALLASAALGHIGFDEIGAHVPISRRFVPDPGRRALYDELYAVFLEIYRRNKAIYTRLNRKKEARL